MLGLLLLLGLPSVAAAQTGNEEAICLTPEVFMCVNFEDYLVGGGSIDTQMNQARYKALGWSFSNPPDSRLRIVNSPVAFGTKAWAVFFPPGDSLTGGGLPFVDLTVPPASGSNPNGGGKKDYYMRHYSYYSINFPLDGRNGLSQWNGPPGSNFTKHIELKGNGAANGNHFYHHDNSLDGNIVHQDGSVSPPIIKRQNMNGTRNTILGQWECIEFHVKLSSTTSTADGLFEGWIDGVQHWSYPNIVTSPIDVLPTTLFRVPNGNSPNVYGPNDFRVLDNIVMSVARIGCIGSAPPPPPNNFILALANAGYTTTGAVATLTQFAGPVKIGFVHTALLLIVIIALLRKRTHVDR